MHLPQGITLRAMTPDDVPAGLRLCRAARWNQVARDWLRFLDGPGGDAPTALVACRGVQVVGSVATVRYAPDLAWVAMVLVDPAERGHGIGRALLDGGLRLVDDVPSVGLDATPAGRPLYLSLGFTDAFSLTRMQRTATADVVSSPDSAVTVRPLIETDWRAVAALDREVMAADRQALLEWLATGAPGYAWVSPGEGQLDGLVCGRHGHDFEHLGPLLATDVSRASALVEAALARVPAGRPVVIDAVDAVPGWVAWLEARGFVAQRPFTRMYRGTPRQRPPGLCAIVGAEFG